MFTADQNHFVRFGRGLLVIAMCVSVGLHWAALQTIAWTQMLVTYSHSATLAEAVQKTFDGDHPCTLCNLVKKGQSDEQKSDYVKSLVKWDAVLGTDWKSPIPAVQTRQHPVALFDGSNRADGPPTPPPRA